MSFSLTKSLRLTVGKVKENIKTDVKNNCVIISKQKRVENEKDILLTSKNI
jgi:hypothetical protein